MTEARAFWTVAPGRGEIRDETLPAAVPGQLLVRTLASGVSRGTEALVFAGRVPASQYQAMRAPLMGGEFPFPVKYGYSAVGRMRRWRGASSCCIRIRMSSSRPAAMCIPVPDAVPTPRAVLAANMETALNMLWDAAPLAGERMLVIGAGVVGLLAASLLARIPAAQVTVVDIDPRARSLARRFGCGFALPDAAPPEQELIVHASASEAGLRLALALRRLRGAHRRGELVRRSCARAAARRGVPCAAAAPDRHPGRCRRAADARPAQPCRAAGDWRSNCWPIPPTTRCWTGRRGSRICRAAMPRILAPGGLCHVITYGTE